MAQWSVHNEIVRGMYVEGIHLDGSNGSRCSRILIMKVAIERLEKLNW